MTDLIVEHWPHSPSLYHTTKVLFTGIPLTNTSQKFTRYNKGQNQFKEAEQASEPETDTAGMLEASNQELKITMINMIC